MEHLVATWGYLALFGICLLSALGIPVGSELATGYAGVLASGQLVSGYHHHLQLVLVIIVATVGEVCGSLIGYAIGRFGGRPLVERVGKYILITRKDLDRTQKWLDGRGESFVFFGRFIPLIRSFVSIAAGIGEMALWKFVALTAAACAIWCTGLASIGYGLGASWRHVLTYFSDVGYVAAALAVLIIAAFIFLRVRQLRAERA